MKVVVTGSNGMLGSDLSRIFSEMHEVIPLTVSDMDLTDRAAVSRVIRELTPDIVVNCAAYTLVDQAEEEPDAAYRVNGFGVQNLALACSDSDATLCHVSTDYVFDGKKPMFDSFDHAAPLNVYGKSKLAGEMFIHWAMSKFYIVRTSWLYGKHGNNFVEKILAQAARSNELKVVHDQKGAPTWTESLAVALRQLVSTGAYGVYHFTDDAGAGISWYEFAVEILHQTGLERQLKPVATWEFPVKAVRPAISTLDCGLMEILGIRRRSWKESLAGYMEGRSIARPGVKTKGGSE